MTLVMPAVIQEETTGCGIACCAALASVSYQQAKKVANSLGIFATVLRLRSDIEPVRKILAHMNFSSTNSQTPFSSWSDLPDLALLAVKWHIYQGQPCWHWVVFVREGQDSYVLDSNARLKQNIRNDFGRIQPKWFLEVKHPCK